MDPKDTVAIEIQDLEDNIALNEGIIASLRENLNGNDLDSDEEESEAVISATLKRLRQRLRTLKSHTPLSGHSNIESASSSLDHPASDDDQIARQHDHGGVFGREFGSKSTNLMPPPTTLDPAGRKRRRVDFDSNGDFPDSKSRRATPSTILSPAASPAPSSDSLDSFDYDDPILSSLLSGYTREEAREDREYFKMIEARKKQEEKDRELAMVLQNEWNQHDGSLSSSQPGSAPSSFSQAVLKTDGTIGRRPADTAFFDMTQDGESAPLSTPDGYRTINYEPAVGGSASIPMSTSSGGNSLHTQSMAATNSSVIKHFDRAYRADSGWQQSDSMAVKPESTIASSRLLNLPSSRVARAGKSSFPSLHPSSSATGLPTMPGSYPGDSALYDSLPGAYVFSGPSSRGGSLSTDTHPLSLTHRPLDSQAYTDPYDYAEPAQTQEELKALLKHIRPDEELTAEEKVSQPPGLKAKLMPHQLLGLSWMEKMESQASSKGGILADDMGLGKTIQSIALLLSRPPPKGKFRPTLVVAPVALMHQWKAEIEKMVRSSHKLRVFVLHGQNKGFHWTALRDFDVILTTYGMLASELKRKKLLDDKITAMPDYRPSPREDCPILGDRTHFHRVILDEAQYIKGRNTKASIAASRINADYRWCLTGTPMQNNVEEMFSLIRFCRIRPYCAWDQFNNHFARPLKSKWGDSHGRAMEKFQALLHIILLRRTKHSKIDGEPILQLPAKNIVEERTAFDPHQLKFYRDLETQTKKQFNRYLRDNSVGKNYSHALVLLLRLRQACCHPFLVTNSGDFFQMAGIVGQKDLIANARELSEDVVRRIKAAEAADEGFECPVCMDACDNAALFPCGHPVCNECLMQLIENASSSDEAGRTKCPHCRATVDAERVTDVVSFKRVYCKGEDGVEPLSGKWGLDSESDPVSDDDDDDDDEDDSDDLKDFIVADDEPEVESGACAGASARRVQAKKKKKRKAEKRSGALGKHAGKSLALLRREGTKSQSAKRQYLRKLREDFVSSTKIDRTIQLLEEIRDRGANEKTIVFSNFTSFLDLVEVPLMDHQDFKKYERYDGSMNADARRAAVQEFTDNPRCKVILVSLKAGNAGLNLTAANHIIMLDPFWNPFVEYQAADRCYRIGQKREVTVHRVLIGDTKATIPTPTVLPGASLAASHDTTVEDRILALQEKKKELVETALDESAGRNVARLGVRELGYLFGVNSL